MAVAKCDMTDLIKRDYDILSSACLQ